MYGPRFDALTRLAQLGTALVLLALALAAPRVEAAATVIPTCNGLPATIFGLGGAIAGTNGPDVIVGSAGPDAINAGAGDDVVCGGPGADTIAGGAGADVLFGESDDAADCVTIDADTLVGGSGNDRIRDFCGENWADGGAGADVVSVAGSAYGGAGADPIVQAENGLHTCGLEDMDCFLGYADGGAGNDLAVQVFGGLADGGPGNDNVSAVFDGDEARGGPGDDRLNGTVGDAVTLDGGPDTDTCVTEGGDDTLISCEIEE